MPLSTENAISQFKAMLYQKTVHSTSEVKAAFMNIHSMPHLFTSEAARQEFGQIGHNFDVTSREQCKNSWGRKQVEAWLDLQTGAIGYSVEEDQNVPVFRQEYVQVPYMEKEKLPKEVVSELRVLHARLGFLLDKYGL